MRPDGARSPALGLSRREWEVASLVAESQSNSEIARRLDIVAAPEGVRALESPRTAESHVGHVLDKLALQHPTQRSPRHQVEVALHGLEAHGEDTRARLGRGPAPTA